MIGWVQLVAFWVAAASGLRVETSTPDALCPEIGEVRRAVEARLGDIEGDGQWLASYALVHHPDGDAADVVRLQLRDPAGRVRLRRDLPRAGASCRAVGQALVVVLDAYFRHPTDAADAVPGEEARPRGVPAVAATPAPAAAPGRPVALGLGIEGGWAGGPSSPALALEMWLAGRSAWAARLQGTWLTERPAQEIPAGATSATATMRSGAIRAGFAARVAPAPRVEVRGGPEALLVIERADIAGLPDGRANTRAAWGVGAAAGVRVPLVPRVALSVDAAADYTPRAWGGSFAVGNVGEVFPLSRFRFLVGAGLSLALFQ